MKRPALVCAAGTVTGVLLAGRPWLAGCVIGLLVLSAILFHRLRRPLTGLERRCAALAVVFLLTGFFRHDWTLADMGLRFLPWRDQSVVMTGHVTDMPRQTASGWMMTVAVEHLHIPAEANSGGRDATGPGGRVRLTLYQPESAFPFMYGDRVEVAGSLRLPERQRNPGGFDTGLHLAARGIQGQLTAEAVPVKLPGQAGNPLVAFGLSLRMEAVRKLESLLPRASAAVLSGMLLGATDALDPELSIAFRMAGLSHVMAVSGANVAFILLPVLYLLRRLGVGRRKAAACALPVLCLYVLMTGFDASIVRAALMAALMLAGHLLWRKTDVAASLAGALTVMLLWNSAWLFDVGFQLSHLATGAIGCFCAPLVNRMPGWMPKTVRQTLAGTLSAQAGVLPVQLGSFHTLNPYAIPVNLLVVPLTGILTLAGAFLLGLGFLVPGMAALPGKWVAVPVDGLCRLVMLVSSLPAAELPIAAPGWIPTLLYAGWLLGFRFLRQRLDREACLRLLAGGLLLTVLVGGVALRPQPRLGVTVVDVGQGDCLLIRTPGGKSLLVDGGGSPSDASGNRVGEQVVLPLLRQMGLLRPDFLISTHPHADHLQGLETVARVAGSGCIVLPEGVDGYDSPTGLLRTATDQGIPVRVVGPGDVVWEEDSFCLSVLLSGFEEPSGSHDVNEASMVLLLTYRSFSMLLAADAGLPAEQALIEAGSLQPVTVLKVGHHGAAGSTGAPLLRAIQPEIAVISVGRNRYGHPAKPVLERLSQRGTAVYQTRTGGALTISSNGFVWDIQPHVRTPRLLLAGFHPHAREAGLGRGRANHI